MRRLALVALAVLGCGAPGACDAPACWPPEQKVCRCSAAACRVCVGHPDGGATLNWLECGSGELYELTCN